MQSSRSVAGFSVIAAIMVALACVSCTQNSPTASVAKPAAAAPGRVANAAGTWKWTIDAGGTAVSHTAVLKQDGEKLTGQFTDGYDNTTVDIKEGKVHDGQVTPNVVRPFMDGTMTLNFAGKLEGDTIKGKVEWTMMDQPSTTDWDAKRGS